MRVCVCGCVCIYVSVDATLTASEVENLGGVRLQHAGPGHPNQPIFIVKSARIRSLTTAKGRHFYAVQAILTIAEFEIRACGAIMGLLDMLECWNNSTVHSLPSSLARSLTSTTHANMLPLPPRQDANGSRHHAVEIELGTLRKPSQI